METFAAISFGCMTGVVLWIVFCVLVDAAFPSEGE